MTDDALDRGTAAYRWLVHGQADPQLPARVLHLYTVRNQLPAYFCARQLGSDRIQIEIHAVQISDDQARFLAQRLLNLPTVLSTALWGPGGQSLLDA